MSDPLDRIEAWRKAGISSQQIAAGVARVNAALPSAKEWTMVHVEIDGHPVKVDLKTFRIAVNNPDFCPSKFTIVMPLIEGFPHELVVGSKHTVSVDCQMFPRHRGTCQLRWFRFVNAGLPGGYVEITWDSDDFGPADK